MNDFDRFVEQAVRSIHASTARRQAMREELLAHLQAAFEQELARHHHVPTAVQAALQRLGDVEDLAAQLQASVPFLERKEILMSAWLWLLCWAVVMGSMMVIAPREMLPGLAVV